MIRKLIISLFFLVGLFPVCSYATLYIDGIERTGAGNVVSISSSCTVGSTCDGAIGMNGDIVYVTAAATITLGPVGPKQSLCVYSTGANAVSIDPDGNDLIRLDGAQLDDGDKITSASEAGNFICIVYESAVGWATWGRSGTWSDDS